jgi:glycosyltransferase involved in cell wall biosynthesis
MLAEAIIKLLQNPNLAYQFGQTGKTKVLMNYTWPQVVRKFRKVYLDAIESRTNKS